MSNLDFSRLTEVEQSELLALLETEAFEAGGWQSWLRHYFARDFSRPFTESQLKFWEWGEALESGVQRRPYVICDPRGLGKSTNAESLIVYLLARQRIRYALYLSGTEDQAEKHLAAIKRRLETDSLLRDYPRLRPRAEKTRNALTNWSRRRLVTADGAVIEAIWLLGSSRGFKSEENERPDLLVMDDIDTLKDSRELTQKKLEILRNDILPAGAEIANVIFPQNLIHRDSICAQILDQRADILTDRIFDGPNPLLKWYDAEKEYLDDGSYRWRIVGGATVDPAVDLAHCERLLARFGKFGFERECQHNVALIDEANDFLGYDEIYHVCTVSEVVAGFKRAGADLHAVNGRIRLPERWQVADGLDWGTTRAHPSAYTAWTRPDQRFPFDDLILGIGEVVLPHFPYNVTEIAEVVSPGGVAKAIREWRAANNILDGQIKLSVMSHEASAALNAFILDMPEGEKVFFRKWKAQKGSGVPAMQNLMDVDPKRPHPFRVYPHGHPLVGEPVMGYTRFILVVPDGQGELYSDQYGRVRVKGAKDSAGFARLRFEIPLYSQFHSGQDKIDDDAVDAARGVLAQFALHAAPLTYHEKVEAAIPERSRYETLREMAPLGDGVTPEAELQYCLARMDARKKVKSNIQTFDEFGRLIQE